MRAAERAADSLSCSDSCPLRFSPAHGARQIQFAEKFLVRGIECGGRLDWTKWPSPSDGIERSLDRIRLPLVQKRHRVSLPEPRRRQRNLDAAASMAAIFDSASPLPPEITAASGMVVGLDILG
jgi:hypothetical protein